MAVETETDEKPMQVMQIPENAQKQVSEFVKKLRDEQMLDSDAGAGHPSGTGCRFTTHDDLHCGDIDHLHA